MWTKLICLKISLLLISLSKCEETTDDLIKSCLFNILNEYFPNKPFLLIAGLNGSEGEGRTLSPRPGTEFPETIIGEIMETQKWTIQIQNTDRTISLGAITKLGRFNDSFVFFREKDVASDDDLHQLTSRMRRNPLWNPRGRTLVVVKPGKTIKDTSELAKKVIEDLWNMSKAVDNLVMVADTSGTIHFYTWFPYRQPDCSQVREVVLLNTFDGGGFRKKTHLFPEKIAPDLQGCELLAATQECIPFVKPPEDTEDYSEGYEFDVINSISGVLNFTLTPIGSKTDMFKLLMHHQRDLAFACQSLNPERYLNVLALPVYAFDDLAWFVPSPTFKTHIMDIFYTFPPRFWLVTISVMISTLLVLIPLVYMENQSIDSGTYLGYVLKLIGASIYGPVVFPVEKSNFRLFIFSFFVYSLHITIAFQSSLLALYRRPPYLRRYSSSRQAVEDGLLVYLLEDELSKFNSSGDDVWGRMLRSDRYSLIESVSDVLTTIAEEKSAIALLPRIWGIHTVFDEEDSYVDKLGRPKILWLDESFAPRRIHMFMSPGNPLYELFQKHILQLMATGMMDLWMEKHVHVKTQWEEDEQYGYANAPLTMGQLGGAFLLLILLLSLAIVVFVVEVCVFHMSGKLKVKKSRRPVQPAVGWWKVKAVARR